MFCVQVSGGGVLAVLDPQPADVSACTAVVLSGAEVQLIGASPFALSVEEGAQIGVAILVLWASAFLFRQIGEFFSVRSSDDA